MCWWHIHYGFSGKLNYNYSYLQCFKHLRMLHFLSFFFLKMTNRHTVDVSFDTILAWALLVFITLELIKRSVSGECVVTVIKGRPCSRYYFSYCRRQCVALQSTLICSPAGHVRRGLAPSSPQQTHGGKYQMGPLQKSHTISIQDMWYIYILFCNWMIKSRKVLLQT